MLQLWLNWPFIFFCMNQILCFAFLKMLLYGFFPSSFYKSDWQIFWHFYDKFCQKNIFYLKHAGFCFDLESFKQAASTWVCVFLLCYILHLPSRPFHKTAWAIRLAWAHLPGRKIPKIFDTPAARPRQHQFSPKFLGWLWQGSSGRT